MKKMFNIMRTTLVLALLVMVSSCLKVDIVLPEQETSNISLSFISCDNAQTRTAAGKVEGVGSENVVESIDVFFYDEEVDNALYHMRIEENDLVASADNINYSYTASIPTDVIKEIFGENTTCNKIYAIANISADTEFQSTSITNLKKTILNTDFSQNQTSFVMSGESSDITFNSSERKISGSVNLYRSASKIDLIIKQVLDIPVTDEYGNQKKDSNGNLVVWEANTEEMIVSLQKGVKTSYIDGYCELSAEKDYFNTNDVTLVKVGENGWKHTTPFYTYPSNWEKEGAIETDLKLIVPWSKSDAPGVYYNTYYTIPISETGLERNTYYKIELTVGRLGTFDEGEDVVLTPASYYIYNWSTNTIRTELLNYRYLVVDQKDVKIYNQNEVRIPYSTSHEVKLELISCTHEDLNNGNDVNVTLTQGVHYYLEDGCIVYHKDLVNQFYSENFDFTPYEVELKISQTSATSAGVTLSETVKITQYPAIYGERDVNTDAENGGDASGNNGFVWVNGYQSDDYKGDSPYRYVESNFKDGHYMAYFDNATSGLSGGGDVTSNTMLVFTISSVEGTDYVIGDPREEVVNESFVDAKHTIGGKDYSIWDYAPGVEGTDSRILQNYYATETSHDKLKNASATNLSTTNIYSNDAAAEAAERTYNMIAPKFRISSGYGAISTDGDRRYYHLMKERCASYQEDGYPAGRWRLPTKAEFEFIIYLSYAEKIPKLFSLSLNYWCAHGHGQPAKDSYGNMTGEVTMGYKTDFGSNKVSVRCVYDDWYWGSDPVIDTKNETDRFIWGDKSR